MSYQRISSSAVNTGPVRSWQIVDHPDGSVVLIVNHTFLVGRYPDRDSAIEVLKGLYFRYDGRLMVDSEAYLNDELYADNTPLGPIAIARWNAVPYQDITSSFKVGVVAFHKYGIEKVEFSVDGGDPITVTEAVLNDRTGVIEYFVTLDPATDGFVEITATVTPVNGLVRELSGPIDDSIEARNGNHSMFFTFNQFGTYGTPEYYCSATTGNDTTGDGTESKPFRQPVRAMRQALTDHGTSQGMTVYLSEGTYQWGPPGWPRAHSTDRWITMTKHPSADRANTIITGPYTGGFSTTLIKADNLTITGDGTVRGETNAWLHNCVIDGPGTGGPYNSRVFTTVTDLQDVYCTDCVCTDYRNGLRDATLLRGCHFEAIWGVPIGQTGIATNCTCTNINELGTGSHGDILRWLPIDDDHENYIAYDIQSDDSDVQQIFAEVHTGSIINNVAIVDCTLTKDVTSDNGSWWECTTDHLLIWNVDQNDSLFRTPQEDYSTTLSNVSIKDTTVLAFTHTPLPEDTIVENVTIIDEDWFESYDPR